MDDISVPLTGQGDAALREDGGLSSAEARRRLDAFGPNRPVRIRRAAAVGEFLLTLADPMALMLAAAAAVYFALGQRTEATVLLVAIAPVLAVDVILEARSRLALKKLAGAVAPRARAVRDGQPCEVPTEDLVPGDLMLLGEGGIVHADAVVRRAANLALDESQLTGESEPVAKIPCPAACEASAAPAESRIFAGSRVVAGHGAAEIAATGEATRYGNIARLVGEAELRSTPLQRSTGRMVRWVVVAALALSAALFALSIWRGASPAQAFLYSISLAMSAVGEEFLLVLTMFLSLGAWRLARGGVLARRLASVETLGATTVICLDKTGTLTRGEFSLQEHRPFSPQVSEARLLEAAVLACELNAVDSMERAIFAHCAEHGIDPDALHARWRLIRDHPFDPIGKHMSHVWRYGDGRERVVAKGALEGVLEHCEATPADRERILRMHSELASRGMRVLAVAMREASAEGSGIARSRSEDETALRLCGLLGFQDPLRPEVPAAIAECESAGIRLKLITGDHVLTAHAVADASGMAHTDDAIITGDQLDRLDRERFAAAAMRCAVFARIRPEQKYAIVDALERAGEVVAMTGDGINDAPALRRADIGVSMGRRGTEVARAVADLVLLDDDFTALVATIREGRRIFANIQRAFLYLVGFKVMLVALALSAPLLRLPILLLPVSLVWMEMIVHPVSALAFEGEEAGNDVMLQPPRDPTAPLVEPASAIQSLLTGALLSAGALALYALRLDRGVQYARSAAMVVAVAGSIAMVWAGLPRIGRWRLAVPSAARFWIVIALVAASLPAFMLIRPIASVMMIAPIDARDWACGLGVAALAAGWRLLGSDFKRPAMKP